MDRNEFKVVTIEVVTWADNADEDLEDLAKAADGVGIFTLESRVRDITEEELKAFREAEPGFFDTEATE